MKLPGARLTASSIILVCLMSCGTDPDSLLEVTVPSGSTLTEVADTLVSRGLLGARAPFKLYARIRGDDRRIKSGRYEFSVNTETSKPCDFLKETRSLRWLTILSGVIIR